MNRRHFHSHLQPLSPHPPQACICERGVLRDFACFGTVRAPPSSPFVCTLHGKRVHKCNPAACATVLIVSLNARVSAPTLLTTVFPLAFALVSALSTLSSLYTTVLAALIVTVCPTAPLRIPADITAMIPARATAATGGVSPPGVTDITTSCFGCTG